MLFNNQLLMNNLKFYLMRLPAVFLMIFFACSDDGGEGQPSTAELLIGTWTTSETDISATVEGQSIVDYLVNVVGMSETDATVRNAVFTSALDDQVTGSLTINSDNTYMSSFAGGSDSGTWSLSADEKTLTLFEGADIIVITINSISATTLNGTISDTLLEDVDGDPGTPDVKIMVSATVIMTK